MAHFAQISEDGIVLRVIVVANAACLDASGKESEAVGAALCEATCGGAWLQTSYNGKIRKNFAGIGYFYDAGLDAFVPPRPYPSWTLNVATCRWMPPVPHPPLGGGFHRWDEDARAWMKVTPQSA